MPPELDELFTPITANPARRQNYIETAPCTALKPYIRCFWGTPGKQAETAADEAEHTLVIPDLCMDIIITRNEQTGKIYSAFCGINDSPFYTPENGTFCFGIRFYAWSIALFSPERMNFALNAFTEADAYVPRISAEISERICTAKNILERKRIAEAFLLKQLNRCRERPAVMNAVFRIIKSHGRTDVSALADECAVTRRTLERAFRESIGIPPKKMLRLIRYQLLWQDCLNPGFSALDSVERLGYFDQSHLLREFKAFHGMTVEDARIAYNMQLDRKKNTELSHLSKTRSRAGDILKL